MAGAADGSADLSLSQPRLVGRRLQTLAVNAGNGCSGSPNLSSDSGWMWNWMFALAGLIGAGEQTELRRRHGERPAPEQRIVQSHDGAGEQRPVHFIECAHADDLIDQ